MSVAKIQPTHCDRLAYVYVRQSTAWQVLENCESTERQYQLQARAIALGWSPTRVEIIDEDQGRSGSSATHRTGFQRLVSEVGLGHVGIVLMLEASRLARNNSDWYLCSAIMPRGPKPWQILSRHADGMGGPGAF